MDVKGQMCRVNALSLFQKNVQPEWEDEVNKNGGQFRIDFRSNLPCLQTLWDKLVFSVITDEFEGADMLSGIRLLDKSTGSRENFFRFEIWTKFDSSQEAMVNSLKSQLEKEYIQLMIEDPQTRPVNKNANDQIPSEWLSKFNNHSNDAAPRQHAS